MNELPLGTTTVFQIGIVVRDLESKARAWKDILGLPEPELKFTDPVNFPSVEYNKSPTFAMAKLAFFNLGQVQLELIEPIGEPSTWKDQLDRYGEGLHHIAFHIEGMPEKTAYFVSKDAPLIQRGEFPGGSYAYFDTVRQLGTVLELLEF